MRWDVHGNRSDARKFFEAFKEGGLLLCTLVGSGAVPSKMRTDWMLTLQCSEQHQDPIRMIPPVNIPSEGMHSQITALVQYFACILPILEIRGLTIELEHVYTDSLELEHFDTRAERFMRVSDPAMGPDLHAQIRMITFRVVKFES